MCRSFCACFVFIQLSWFSFFLSFFFGVFLFASYIMLPPLQSLFFLQYCGLFSLRLLLLPHPRMDCDHILIAFKFLDLKALCVCGRVHAFATTVSFSYFVQHTLLSTIRVLFQYTRSNLAHERAIRFFCRSLCFFLFICTFSVFSTR